MSNLKVLQNEYQWCIDRLDQSLEDIHGPGIEVGGPVYSRVGFYLLGKDSWYEYKMPTGEFVSVRKDSTRGSFKFTMELLEPDLYPQDVIDTLKTVKSRGFKLSKEVEKRMRTSELAIEIHEGRRRAALFSLRFMKKYKDKPHEEV